LNKIKSLAGQTAVYGISSILGRLINYALVPIHTRIFTNPAQFGVVTEMYTYVSFLIIVLMYGMETAFFRYNELEKDKNNVFNTVIVSITSTSILFIALTSIFSQSIAELIQYPNNNEYVIFFAIIVGLDAITSIAFARLRANNKPKKFALIKIFNIIIFVALNVLFYYDFSDVFAFKWIYNKSVGYVFIANMISSIFTLIVLLPEYKSVKFNIDWPLLKKMLIYALPLLIFGLAGSVNETLDRLLLKYILPEDISMRELGIYGACYKISIFMTIFIQAFRYAAEPFFFSQAKEKNSSQIYADVMKYFIIICTLIFLSIMMYIDIVMKFVGENYRIGKEVVPILLIANMFLGVIYNLSIWYKLTNKTMYGAYIAILGALITIVLNILWIPIYGYVGSAWATLFCYASMMIISYIIGQKYYPVNYNLKSILFYIITSFAIYLLSTYLNFGNDAIKYSINTSLIILFLFLIIKIEKINVKQYLKRI